MASVGGIARNLIAIGLGIALSGAALAAEPAKDFTLRDISNQPFTLSDLKGKVVLVNFWATWCGPCKVEMSHLATMYPDLKDQGFEIVSISEDDARNRGAAIAYFRRKRFPFTGLLDPQADVGGTWNATKTLPFNVLISKDFTVAKTYSGYNPGDENVMLADIQTELAKPAPPAE